MNDTQNGAGVKLCGMGRKHKPDAKIFQLFLQLSFIVKLCHFRLESFKRTRSIHIINRSKSGIFQRIKLFAATDPAV